MAAPYELCKDCDLCEDHCECGTLPINIVDSDLECDVCVEMDAIDDFYDFYE